MVRGSLILTELKNQTMRKRIPALNDRDRHWKMLLFLPFMILSATSCRDESFFDRDADKSKTIETQLRANPNYSRFVEALDNTGLINYIDDSGLWTVYAPNNEAMGSLNTNPATDEELVELIKQLNYHIGVGLKYTTAIQDNDRMLTRNGKFLNLDKEPYTVDGVEFASINPDQDANNGVIHELNFLLVPPSSAPQKLQTTPSVSKFAEALEEFKEFVYNPMLSIDRNLDGEIDDSVFVESYGLAIDIGSEASRRTIFAPTNQAVDAYLATKGLTSLLELPTADLQKLINKHILIAYKPSTDLAAGTQIETSGGTGKFSYDPSIVVTPDVQASNAVIHIINTVLTH